MSNTSDMYIISTFAIINDPVFITENYSSKFTIMSFWTPAPKSPAENCIPKKSLDKSLQLRRQLGLRFFSPWYYTWPGVGTPTYRNRLVMTQPAITCSKLTVETLEQGVKYVQS